MPLRVYCMMQYLTVWDGIEPRSTDYSSLMVVKAVKGRDPGGRPAAIRYAGERYAFGPGDPAGGVALWVAWAAAVVNAVVPLAPIVLVPIPNRNAVHGSAPDFPTAGLAQAVAAAIGPRALMRPELWWDQVMEPASEGGPRHAHQLYRHLVLAPAPIEGVRVLLDDVFTLGGHLRASAAKLGEAGRAPQLAICCGRTQHQQLENPFNVPVEELSDFDPADPYGFGALMIDEETN